MFYVQCVCLMSLSCARLFAAPWTAARQAPLSLGILQARILEWVAISFSKGSSQPRNRTLLSCVAGRFFTDWATCPNCLTHLRKGTSLWYIKRSHLIANEKSLFVFYENVYPWWHYSTPKVKHLIQPVNTTSEQQSNWKERQKSFSGSWPSERSGKRAVWNKSKIKVSK